MILQNVPSLSTYSGTATTLNAYRLTPLIDKASWLTATFISVMVYLVLSLVWPHTESLNSGDKYSHDEEVDVNANAMVDRESSLQYDKYSGQKVRVLDG